MALNIDVIIYYYLFLAGLLPLLGLLPPRGDLFRGLGLLLPLLGGGEPPLRRGGDPFLAGGDRDFFLSGDFFFSGVAGALLLPLEEEEEEEDEEEEDEETTFRRPRARVR